MNLYALVAALLLVAPGAVWGERYLTVPEAQKLSFPQADRFTSEVVRFSPEQRKILAQAAGSPVRNLGNAYWIAWQGTNKLGVMVTDSVLGKHELIDYAVAISPEGAVIHVEILEYRESHGGQVRGEKWREQFHGKTAKSPLRLNDDIYNISGATVSSRNVTAGIKRVLATFDLFIRPRLPDRLPEPEPEP